MEITRQEQTTKAIRLALSEDGQELGHIYLYLIKNEGHVEPYGLFEKIFVEEAHRSKGVGSQLVKALIAEAKAQGCYKLVAYSRNSRPDIHAWYLRLGFEDWGKEFRMNLL